MTQEHKKREAAHAAVECVSPGSVVGVGSGSTTNHFIDALAAVRPAGAVASSQASARRLAAAGIRVLDLNEVGRLSLYVDGADEATPRRELIKGGGGALTREKIVAAASTQLVVIADDSIRVPKLGAFPLPVEIVPFGWHTTMSKVGDAARMNGCKGPVTVRGSENDPFVTDNGNYILDCAFGEIDDPERVATQLSLIPGVVEHGLFIGMTHAAVIVGANGVEIIGDKP